MKFNSRLFWTVSGLSVLGLVFLFGVILRNSQGENLVQFMGLDQKLGAQVPLDATFKDETGKDVKLAEYFNDRPVVLMLIFYQCKGSCLLEFEGAMRSFKAMKADSIGKDYDVVSLSIHPKETPSLAAAKKVQYLEEYNRPSAEKGWHFLTGTEDQIRKVTDKVGFRYRYIPEKDQIVHPTGLVVLTPEGKVSKYWYGTEYSAPILRNSLVAAAEKQIGGTSESILFGCFQYDAATGKTRLNVMRALQLSGFATLAILVFSIVTMNRTRKRELEQMHPGEEDAQAPNR